MYSQDITLDQVFYEDCNQILVNFDLNINSNENDIVKLYSVVCLTRDQ